MDINKLKYGRNRYVNDHVKRVIDPEKLSRLHLGSGM